MSQLWATELAAPLVLLALEADTTSMQESMVPQATEG